MTKPIDSSNNSKMSVVKLSTTQNPTFSSAIKSIKFETVTKHTIFAFPYAVVMNKVKTQIEAGCGYICPEQRMINGFSSGFVSGFGLSPLFHPVKLSNFQDLSHIFKKDAVKIIKSSFSLEHAKKTGLRGGFIGLAIEAVKLTFS